MKKKICKIVLSGTVLICTLSPMAMAMPTPQSGDRAVEIARQSRDRIEQNGKDLKASSNMLFTDFAKEINDLQKLVDTRKQLTDAGLLKKGDPAGDARRAHLNGRILTEVGELKQSCDTHLPGLLKALERFDQAVAESLVDSQATRSINSNYELAINEYLKVEKDRFTQAADDAEKVIAEFRKATDDREKKRLLKKYKRAKKRLKTIENRRKLYEARMKVVTVNQQLSTVIRQKIREDGHDIPARFRELMAGLYNTFAKITPVAEVGGTGEPAILANMGFSNVNQMQETLAIVDGALGKLDTVLDGMVDEVLGGLSEIQVMSDRKLTTGSFSASEEMEFLRKQRQNWNS